MRVASQTSKEAMLCDVHLTGPPDSPLCAAEVDFVILLRWSLRHEEVGKERQPHRRLRRRLLAPALKRAKQDAPAEAEDAKAPADGKDAPAPAPAPASAPAQAPAT